MDNGGLFADIGFSFSRTILAEVHPLTRWVRKSRPEGRPLPAPPLFLVNDNILCHARGARGCWNSLKRSTQASRR